MTTLLLVGHGKMGSALLSRWNELRPTGISHFAVVDPHVKQDSSADIQSFSALNKIPETLKPDIIVFAIKPQQMEDALPQYAKQFGAQPLYLSIAAGKTLEFFATHLGADAAVVRAMPNTPSLIGEGMTALCASKTVDDAQKKTVTELMEAAGKTAWMDETWIDAATAISGSGPAYVFLFMEALAEAAVQCGLPKALAIELVRQTVRGSALLAEDAPFGTLCENVTSPGGTTEAAIKTLQEGGFEKVLCDAAKAAMQRAKELNKVI